MQVTASSDLAQFSQRLCESWHAIIDWTAGQHSPAVYDKQSLMTVKTAELADITVMRKTDCFGETRLVPCVTSSS